MRKREEELVDFLQDRLGKRLELRKDVLECYLPELTVDELAKTLRISASLIIAFFWKSGRNITKNQPLSLTLIEEYCKSRRIRVVPREKSSVNQIINEYLRTNSSTTTEKTARIPVVSVMGHVDHGKSTTLDTICGTRNQQLEEGGITQRISVYPVEFRGRKINFLDIPGHSIFLAMRERGAAFTDLVMLVIAADDGVMPQTVEVINHIHKYKLPTIVFINDKHKSGNLEEKVNRIKSQLQEHSLVPADWGGETITVTGSAVDQTSTNELLENILLMEEICDWKAVREGIAGGTVLDSYINNKEGAINTILLREGTLKKGANLFIGSEYGKIRRINDFTRKEREEITPGEIVQVSGLSFQAEPGDSFLVLEDRNLVKKIRRIIPAHLESGRNISLLSAKQDLFSKKKVVNLILLADSQSSLEALVRISNDNETEEVIFNVIQAEVSDVNESIINLAKITESLVLLFNIKLNQQRIKDLRDNEIEWSGGSVIYHISDSLGKVARSLQEKKKVERILGIAEVKKIFSYSKVGKISGCQVISGTVSRNSSVNLFRRGKQISSSKIGSLQSDRNNVKEVSKNQECGIVLNNFTEFEIGDHIIAYSLIDEE